MSGDTIDAESVVSGSKATIPSQIRRELGIRDGDHLLWQLEDDESVGIDVVHQQLQSFANFTGYDGTKSTDVTSEHDSWGVDLG